MAPLLGDLALGRLARDQAVPAWTHVSTCVECQETLATMHRVRQSLADTVDRRLQLHPDPEAIVRMALGPGEIAPADRDTIEAHLRLCASCRKEVELARNVDFESGKTGETKSPRFGRLPPLLAAALVAVAALAYPAFIGLTELPALRRAQHESAAEVSELKARAQQLETRLGSGSGETQWSGGVALLLLRAATRGEASPAEVRLRPGQPYQPVLIDYSLAELLRREPGTWVRVELSRAGAPVWQSEATAATLWDAPQGVVSLLLPVSVLSPGSYRIELRAASRAEPLFARDFSVAAPAPDTTPIAR